MCVLLVTPTFVRRLFHLRIFSNWRLNMQSACAHRAAGASPVLRRTPQPCSVGRVASPGCWGSGSASLCRPSVASGGAGSSVASHLRRRNIHWRRVEEDGISSSSETRLNRRQGIWVWFCTKTASPVLLIRWSPARRRCLNGRFAPRLQRHGRVVELLFSPVLPLLRSSHRTGLVVCWTNRAVPSAWAFITLDKQPTASRLCCMRSCSCAGHETALCCVRNGPLFPL